MIPDVITTVLAKIFVFIALFFIIVSFIVGWKIWLIILGISFTYWFIDEIIL